MHTFSATHWHLLFSFFFLFFLIATILMGVRWYLMEVLIWISLISAVEHLFMFVDHLHIFVEMSIQVLWLFFLRFYLFSERGEGKEKKKERNINVWEKHWLVASCPPPNGDPARNAGTGPDRESNNDLSVCRPALNPLGHGSQGIFFNWVTFAVVELY